MPRKARRKWDLRHGDNAVFCQWASGMQRMPNGDDFYLTGASYVYDLDKQILFWTHQGGSSESMCRDRNSVNYQMRGLTSLNWDTVDWERGLARYAQV